LEALSNCRPSEHIEDAEDRAAGRLGSRRQVKLTAEEKAESGNAGSGPGGDVGDSAVFDFAILAEGLANEDGRGRVAIGDLRHVHDFMIEP